MKLDNIVIATGVVRAGDTVGEAFRECLRASVNGVPVVDAGNQVIGLFSIRETLRMSCIPEIAVNYADILGDNLGEMTVPEDNARQIIRLPIDGFILSAFASIHSVSPVIKAITLMEKHATDTVFVIDDGDYRGVVTIEAIARRMLEISNV